MGFITSNPNIDLLSEQQPSIYYVDDGTAIFLTLGDPTGLVAADIGSLAVAQDGSGVYYKSSGNNSTAGWILLTTGSGSTPGLPDHSVQFNNGGAFNGNAAFLYNIATSPNLTIKDVTSTDIVVAIKEATAGATPTIGGSPALLTLQAANQAVYWLLGFVNDASPNNWAMFIQDTGELLLQTDNTHNTSIFLLEGGITEAGTSGCGMIIRKAGSAGAVNPVMYSTADDVGILGTTTNPEALAGVTNILQWGSTGVTVTGKLTVTGAIDPTSISFTGANTLLFIDSQDGQNAALSAANHGRIRYNNNTHKWQGSVNGGAYTDFATGTTAVPGTPLHSVQFNAASTFTGNAGFTYDPTSATEAVLTAQANAHTPLVVNSAAVPSANILEVQLNGSNVFIIDFTGETVVGSNLTVTGDATFGNDVTVNNNLVVHGNASIDGKLTVTGAIDPTSISFTGADTLLFIDSADGQNAPISASGHGRFRYNNATHTMQLSVNGGAYADLNAGGSGTVNAGLAKEIAYYPANGTTVDGADGGSTVGFYWDNTNARAGIGTSSPSTPLHLFKASGANTTITIENSGASLGSAIDFVADARTFEVGVGGSSTGTSASSYFIYDVTAGGTNFRFIIDSNARTGINPGANSLVGTLHAFGHNANFPTLETDSAGGQITNVPMLQFNMNSAATNSVALLATLQTNSSGSAAAGFGSQLLWQLEDSGANSNNAASLSVLWANATHGAQSADIVFANVDAGGSTPAETFRITGNALPVWPHTNTAGGTTGDQTINKPSGTVNIAAAGTTITVTNSLCTTSSLVFAVIRTNDATASVLNVVPHNGSFDINIVACTAEVSIGFLVINK